MKYQDEIFQNKINHDEISKDEIFQDKIFQDKIFQDKIYQDKIYQDKMIKYLKHVESRSYWYLISISQKLPLLDILKLRNPEDLLENHPPVPSRTKNKDNLFRKIIFVGFYENSDSGTWMINSN